MTIGAALSIALIAILVGVLPVWPWSRGWDYRPAIATAVALTFVVILWVMLFI